jgi:hypothetical protein
MTLMLRRSGTMHHTQIWITIFAVPLILQIHMFAMCCVTVETGHHPNAPTLSLEPIPR